MKFLVRNLEIIGEAQTQRFDAQEQLRKDIDRYLSKLYTRARRYIVSRLPKKRYKNPWA